MSEVTQEDGDLAEQLGFTDRAEWAAKGIAQFRQATIKAESERIVEWLRNNAPLGFMEAFEYAADAIASGEHEGGGE